MDGNGRWAQQRGLPRAEGHIRGQDALRATLRAAAELGIEYLTVYAFSTENWARPQQEVEALMELLVSAIHSETPELMSQGVRLRAIGDLSRLPERARQSLYECIERTKDNKQITLVLALSYSSPIPTYSYVQGARSASATISSGRLPTPSSSSRQSTGQTLARLPSKPH